MILSRFGALLPLAVTLLFAYFWDIQIATNLSGSQHVWGPTIGSLIGAGLVLICGWWVYRSHGRALLVDLAFLLAGAAVVFANPLRIGTVSLNLTIGGGVMLDFVGPFLLLLGLASLGDRTREQF